MSDGHYKMQACHTEYQHNSLYKTLTVKKIPELHMEWLQTAQSVLWSHMKLHDTADQSGDGMLGWTCWKAFCSEDCVSAGLPHHSQNASFSLSPPASGLLPTHSNCLICSKYLCCLLLIKVELVFQESKAAFSWYGWWPLASQQPSVKNAPMVVHEKCS